MKFNDFVKTALSNDPVCITNDILAPKVTSENLVEKPECAYRWIDSKYAEREVVRFTLIPNKELGVNGTRGVLAVELAEPVKTI